MKKTILTLIAVISALTLAAQGRTYYVSASGNDAATGLSEAAAWKSLDNINATTFKPGDKILLKGGETWHGQLVLKGSGTPDQPIVLSSFGKGRAVIDTDEAEGQAIFLHNVGGWTIKNLEITSGAQPKLGVGRSGIVVTVDEPGLELSHITLADNFIHDIWGQMGGTRGRNSAILVNCGIRRAGASVKQPSLSNVLIEGNRIERVDKTGIVTGGARNSLVIRRNYMDDLGGDGIIVSGAYRGLIEYNEIHRSCLRSGYLDLPGDENWWPHTAACWLDGCEATVMQFNEVYNTGREPKNGDGEAYDFDTNCKDCVLQYNYSKENNGFLLLMYNIDGNIARYNISENDKTHLVQIQCPLSNNSIFYNNVFYVDHGTLDIDFFEGNAGDEDMRTPATLGARFYNNIFYATGQGRFRTVYSQRKDAVSFDFDETTKAPFPAGTLFRNNCYYGPWKNGLPDDPDAIIADPMFVAPGTGGTGLNTLGGYALKEGSPCIDAGLYLPEAGGMDFFRNLLADGKLDVGAYEAFAGAFDQMEFIFNVPIEDVRCSDPFIYPDPESKLYYMYSSGGRGVVYARASKDLKNWTKPFDVMRFSKDHWAGDRAASWAAEVHFYKGKYYLFTTSNDQVVAGANKYGNEYPHRCTQIYVADSPRGPFRDFTNGEPHTPWGWPSLDGTLWIENGVPYMVFCREWLQAVDGTMEAVRLPDDLGVPTEKPFTLFRASAAPWSLNRSDSRTPDVHVTDGPWLFKTQKGKLGMLWSSWYLNDYAIGVAYSKSGKLKGPWVQEKEPLYKNNGGHGMLFRTFDGQLKLSMHIEEAGDPRPGRKPVIFDVDDSGNKLVLKK